MDDPSITRRRAHTNIGAGAAAAIAAACGKSSSDGAAPSAPTTAAAGASSGTASASCVLMPEMTEGPYYIADEAIRRDITEGKPGTPLRLDLTVLDATTCAPVPGATVEVWHTDAAGDYSGFGNGASSRTFMRGGQRSGNDGKVAFDTVYPGWYQGRAVHIHVKVHDGAQTHTGQLFFADDVSEAVYATAPYSQRGGQFLRNSQDNIYRGGGAQSTLALAKNGDAYVGTLSLGVHRA
jgi:protocatechuate 3,4-dioxygenase beta subunit